jgi:eukaryotic-like serine/threonine-protein kinase
MKSTTACPCTEELQQLLANSLSDERVLQCTEHMETCSCCQARLEGIATDGSDICQVVRGLHESEPQATSAYWPALKAVDPGVHVQVPTKQLVARTRDVSLHFLQPASDSAYLGRLAHFDVMRILGRGGMGVVVEAFDSRLRRNVALKILDLDLLGDEVAHQRFCREARAAASITHENVVAVHQVERTEEGLPYLVMQVIGGESLEHRLEREKKLPFREVVRIGMQAAHGLAAAHAQGLTHRDIKPGNIMLESPQDRVKLTDFGLARAAEDVKLTHTGYVSGTPLYMAPEQANGEKSDHRSDLFSLGAIMYEMCAGQPPFTGNSALAILKQVSEAKHRPLRELNPDVPEWLADTIDMLLAKKPEDRIQTADQLVELLEYEWALTKGTSSDLPTVCQVEAQKEAKRNRMIAAAIGATFLVLGLLGGWFIANRTPSPSVSLPSAEPVALLSANAGAVSSVAFDPTGNTIAMAVEEGTIRLWDWPTRSFKSTFSAHRGNIFSVCFAPKGDILASAGDDGLVKLWNLGQPGGSKTLQHPNAVRGLVFTPDGQTLYTGDREGGLRICSLDGAKPRVEAQQPGAVYAIAISPDGETLATAGSDKIVRLWNAKTLTQKLPLEGHAGPVHALAFHRDGKRLASVGWDKMVRIWDTGSGLIVKSWEGHEADITTVAYSPDGLKLATGGLDGAAKVWNAETGELLTTYRDHNVAVQTIAFSHDGKLLATGGRDGAVRLWNVE